MMVSMLVDEMVVLKVVYLVDEMVVLKVAYLVDMMAEKMVEVRAYS